MSNFERYFGGRGDGGGEVERGEGEAAAASGRAPAPARGADGRGAPATGYLDPMIRTADADLRRILAVPRSLGVIGAKADPWEAAFYVPKYLRERGWAVVGVNPKLAGQDWLGAPAVAGVAALRPVEVVEVFRRSDALVGVAEELLALPWRPSVVWFQLGIANDDAASMLAGAGIEVVQDRCMMPEHRRLVGG